MALLRPKLITDSSVERAHRALSTLPPVVAGGRSTADHEPVPLAEVCEFLDEHGCALVNASELLRGPAAAGRTLRLIETAAGATRLSRALRREIEAVHRLLSGADVGDPDGIGTLHFATVAPESPVVEEICLLTDRVRALLDCIDDHEASGDAGRRSSETAHAA